MKTILIADSGASNAKWIVLKNGKVIHSFSSNGISPIYQTEEEIFVSIEKEVFIHVADTNIDAIRFYGSGCIPHNIFKVQSALSRLFRIDDIEVHSDLVAVAHALCGNNAGIACIMGTGSNSCEWNGTEIVKQVPPLGFILGDEGSGASLGKMLVGDILKNQLPDEVKNKFLMQYNMTQGDILDRVYNEPFPSRFLASLSPFILQNINTPSVRNIAERGFNDFFDRNVMQYNYRDNSVNIVGSIGWFYSDIIKQIAIKKEIMIGTIEQSPIEGLVRFYEHR